MTTRAAVSTTIDAPPDAVWAWVGRLETHPDWSPKPYQVELVSGEPNAVGSRYRSVGWVPGESRHRNDVEITEVVAGRRLAFRAEDDMGAFDNSYDLNESGGSTKVTYQLVFPPLKGFAALVIPLLFPLVGKADMRKRLRLLKARAEQADRA